MDLDFKKNGERGIIEDLQNSLRDEFQRLYDIENLTRFDLSQKIRKELNLNNVESLSLVDIVEKNNPQVFFDNFSVYGDNFSRNNHQTLHRLSKKIIGNSDSDVSFYLNLLEDFENTTKEKTIINLVDDYNFTKKEKRFLNQFSQNLVNKKKFENLEQIIQLGKKVNISKLNQEVTRSLNDYLDTFDSFNDFNEIFSKTQPNNPETTKNKIKSVTNNNRWFEYIKRDNYYNPKVENDRLIFLSDLYQFLGVSPNSQIIQLSKNINSDFKYNFDISDKLTYKFDIQNLEDGVYKKIKLKTDDLKLLNNVISEIIFYKVRENN